MTDTLTPSRPAASCRCPDTSPALPIYLDYAATTPVDPRVAQAMLEFMTGKFGNPASTSDAFGQEASLAVARARRQVAALPGRRFPDDAER